MKHLSDLTSYKGILPYASEIFGVYQPMLAWKSERMRRRIEAGTQLRFNDLVERLYQTLAPQYTAKFQSDCGVECQANIAVANNTSFLDGTVIATIGRQLPPISQLNPTIWGKLLTSENLAQILNHEVVAKAKAIFKTLCKPEYLLPQKITAENAVRSFLARESSVAGFLQLLYKKQQITLLQKLFYGNAADAESLWNALDTVYDPFAAIDPSKVLDQVGLSPLGIAHLFRQYFFELDTFLGTPVSHVWLSPGATVELFEIHTRRVLIEQSLEQSSESTQKTEKSLTQQDDLADAIKDDNRNNTKLGLSVSSNQSWGWGSANESANLGMESSQQTAREHSHKEMRQQSDKLSSEIKQSFKSTFKTTTETTDVSSKRYVLSNTTSELINYELRRKMRQVAVQVQDIGTFLCWQTYVDRPGDALGVARLVHIGVSPDLASVPAPEMVVPPDAFTEDKTITLPLLDIGGSDNDVTYVEGEEINPSWPDSTDHIGYYFTPGAVRCSQPNFKLSGVSIDPQGAAADIVVAKSSIQGDPANGFTFTLHLRRINYGGQNSIPIKATLYWEPNVDQNQINQKNADALAKFTAREKQLFQKAFLDEARERIKLASNIQPRSTEDLREEERIVVYRQLIRDLIVFEQDVPEPDSQTQHVIAELINSIFDVDKMLYFVAPEWWRPQPYHRHQQLGGIDPVVDQQGNAIYTAQFISEQDTFAWGDRDTREDNYYVTEDSTPARLGSSIGWILQLDGDDLRNAFLNSPWVKTVLPIRPGKEAAALNWLRQIEGINGIGPNDIYAGPEPELNGKPIFDVLMMLANRVKDKNEQSISTQPFSDPSDPNNTIYATPVDRVYEYGFDPLAKGFQAKVQGDFEVFDQWLEVLPTDQVAAVEVKYDPKTGRQL